MKYTNWALKSHRAEELKVKPFTFNDKLPVSVQRTQNWARGGEVEIDVIIKSETTGKAMRLVLNQVEARELGKSLIRFSASKISLT